MNLEKIRYAFTIAVEWAKSNKKKLLDILPYTVVFGSLIVQVIMEIHKKKVGEEQFREELDQLKEYIIEKLKQLREYILSPFKKIQSIRSSLVLWLEYKFGIRGIVMQAMNSQPINMDLLKQCLDGTFKSIWRPFANSAYTSIPYYIRGEFISLRDYAYNHADRNLNKLLHDCCSWSVDLLETEDQTINRFIYEDYFINSTLRRRVEIVEYLVLLQKALTDEEKLSGAYSCDLYIKSIPPQTTKEEYKTLFEASLKSRTEKAKDKLRQIDGCDIESKDGTHTIEIGELQKKKNEIKAQIIAEGLHLRPKFVDRQTEYTIAEGVRMENIGKLATTITGQPNLAVSNQTSATTPLATVAVASISQPIQ